MRKQKSKNLILLGSGWTKGDIVWGPLRKSFKAEGFDTMILPYPYRGFGRLQDTAQMVGKYVEAVHEYYEHITYIGHSMGGLVGRYLIQCLPEGRHIDSYVSLASPHKGVYLANFAPSFSFAAKQMGTRSNFLDRLNNNPWPIKTPALSLAASWEFVVWPQSSTKFNHADDHIVIPNTTHATIPLHPRTFCEIYSWLAFDVLMELCQDATPGFDSKALFS